MTPQQRKRCTTLGFVGLAALGFGTFLVCALQENMMYFVTPTELLDHPTGKNLRLGGMVETGSVTRDSNTLTLSFQVTDFKTSQKVSYQGITPDLFREGQGVVAEGSRHGDIFIATKILAKHDENYMPPTIEKKMRG